MPTTNRNWKYWTFIYFLQSTASPYLVKIGQSSRLAKRTEALICGSPVPLTMIYFLGGNSSAEELLHFAFADQRAHGEWFYPHSNLKALVRAWKSEGVKALTPDIAEATLPKAATFNSDGKFDLTTMLAYYRESFRVSGLDGAGTPTSERMLALPLRRDI